MGEALVRTLRRTNDQPVGLDIKPSEFTDCVGSITNRDFVHNCVSSVDVVVHTATLHKPHIGTHSRQEFVDTNVSGTLNLLEEAVANSCQSFILTSTTSTFGHAMRPAEDGPAVWVTENLRPKPKNIYGVTKMAAEDLCYLFHKNAGLPTMILKTSRFFPEEDDDRAKRHGFDDANLKVSELLFRRADIEDMVTAHQSAISKASDIGFDRFIISATTPFQRSDIKQLMVDAPSVVERRVPDYVDEYAKNNWRMFPTIDRVYDNSHAREILGWEPKYNFERVINRLRNGEDYRSKLARQVGAKGYHKAVFEDGPFPVESF